MRSMALSRAAAIEDSPLALTDLPKPSPGAQEILIRVHACGVCRTDLHIIEGELDLPKLPLVPGHQIIGTVEAVGPGVTRFQAGDRVGVPWLNWTCGGCSFCRRGNENLCENARFTGYHVDGGYAEYAVVSQDFAYAIPATFSDLEAAPLLCSGVIGMRSLRLSEVRRGDVLGMYGFGASAHVTIQVARHWGCEVFVFTRSERHRELARSLGASWAGAAEDEPPAPLDGAIIFAPVGELVPQALRVLRKGGTIALAGIHMTPIPQMEYRLLYHERTIRSVANSTRQDVEDMLSVAAEIPIRVEVQAYGLEQANQVLQHLKAGKINGAAVLQVWAGG